MKKIKLIWDYRGPDAKEIAKHHAVHLQEFALMENLSFHEIDIEVINPFLVTAFVVVDETDMKVYRDALKPHRGELA